LLRRFTATLNYTPRPLATLLLCEGVPPKQVQKLLWHANISITLGDTEGHVLPGMGRQAADAMGEALR
jgi:hypothetical protein